MSFKPHTTEQELHGSEGYSSFIAPHVTKAGWNLNIIGKGSIEDKLNGVILPGFDWDLNLEDASFGTSVGDFWSTAPDKDHPKDFRPGTWAVPFFVYTFLGASNQHFFSPANRSKMIGAEECSKDDLADAFNDLWKHVKFGKSFTQQEKEYYTKTGKSTSGMTDAPIPNRQSRFLSLAATTSKKRKEGELSVVCYTSAAHGYMLEQTRWRREESDALLDPALARYLLGNPTKVDAALVWDVMKMQLDPKDAQETNCIAWTDAREVLRDPLKTAPITQTQLAARFNMWDPNNWTFPTYQEQVDFMVEEYVKVDVELIKEVCGHKADVGERKTRLRPDGEEEAAAKERDKEAAEAYDPLAAALAAATGGKSSPPSAPSAPPKVESAPPVEEAVPVAVAEPYAVITWTAGEPGTSPRQVTAAQIKAAAGSSLMVKYEGAWKSAAVVATILFPPVAEEAVPAAEASVPLPDVVPVVETVPAADVVSAAVANTEVYDMPKLRATLPAGVYDRMSAAEVIEADAALIAVEKHRLRGESVPEALTDKIFALAMI